MNAKSNMLDKILNWVVPLGTLLVASWVILFFLGYSRGLRMEALIRQRARFNATLDSCRIVAQAILKEVSTEELDAALWHDGKWDLTDISVPLDQYSDDGERLLILISNDILYITSLGPDRVRNLPADTVLASPPPLRANVDWENQGGDIYVMIRKVGNEYTIVDPYKKGENQRRRN